MTAVDQPEAKTALRRVATSLGLTAQNGEAIESLHHLFFGMRALPMKILVVDDSKVMRAIVRRTLRQAGFGGLDVQEAGNGKEGFELTKSFAPDIILCDWNMPEMNGIELLRTLRAEGNLTPFGFVTSEGTPEMRVVAENAGALFLITKPFTAEDFENILGPFLNRAA